MPSAQKDVGIAGYNAAGFETGFLLFGFVDVPASAASPGFQVAAQRVDVCIFDLLKFVFLRLPVDVLYHQFEIRQQCKKDCAGVAVKFHLNPLIVVLHNDAFSRATLFTTTCRVNLSVCCLFFYHYPYSTQSCLLSIIINRIILFPVMVILRTQILHNFSRLHPFMFHFLKNVVRPVTFLSWLER